MRKAIVALVIFSLGLAGCSSGGGPAKTTATAIPTVYTCTNPDKEAAKGAGTATFKTDKKVTATGQLSVDGAIGGQNSRVITRKCGGMQVTVTFKSNGNVELEEKNRKAKTSVKGAATKHNFVELSTSLTVSTPTTLTFTWEPKQ